MFRECDRAYITEYYSMAQKLDGCQKIAALCVWYTSCILINFTKVDHCKSVHCLVRRPIYKYIYFKNDGLEVYQFKTEYIIHMTAWATWNSQQKLTALNSVIIHSIVLINHLADTVGLEKYLS